MTVQAAYTNNVNNMYSRNVPASHSVSHAQKNSPQQHSQNPSQQSIPNFSSSTSFLVAYLNKQNNTAVTNNGPPPHGSVDNPLTKFTLSIPSLSLTPLTGQDVLTNVKKSCSCVSSNYLPCVDFLVTCQQDLRTGLAVATGKKTNGKGRSSRAEAMNGTQVSFVSRDESLHYLLQIRSKNTLCNTHILSFPHASVLCQIYWSFTP